MYKIRICDLKGNFIIEFSGTYDEATANRIIEKYNETYSRRRAYMYPVEEPE